MRVPVRSRQRKGLTGGLGAFGVFAFLAMLVCIWIGDTGSIRAADPPNQPFDLIYTATDVKYRIYQDGVGMLGQTEGTLNVPALNGSSVVKAYLVWAGLGRDDDGVFLRRDAGADTLITPDFTWNRDTFGGEPTWGCCGEELTVYAADVTAENIVLTGNHTYTVSDMEITHQRNNGSTVAENWGYSLIIVYEDPTLDRTRDIFIKLGNDGLFANWTDLIGPDSDVQCLAFPPSTQERRANYSVIVGGVENENRPNSLWGRAGSDDYLDRTVEGGTWNQSAGLIHLPPNIVGIGGVGGTQLDGPFPNDSVFPEPDDGPPFADRNGNEWDEYQRFDIPVTAGDDWVCVQVESASQRNRPELPPIGENNLNRPASIGFMGFIVVLENTVPDEPLIDIVKYTNGADANDPNGDDVPFIAPGEPVTWTYEVLNAGIVAIPEADITVTDTVEGAVTQIVDKGNGDAILAPAESWLYQVVGTAIDLGNPPANPDLTLVPDVCTQDGAVTNPSTAYTNVGTVTIPSMSAEDPSSYCNPEPLIDIIKYTNGQDANDPDGADVPIIVAGDVVSWTYEVTNIGTVDIPEADITVTDTVEGAVTQIVDKGDGDAVLAPAEAWLYQATGVALGLVNPPAVPGLALVPDVCTRGGLVTPAGAAYTNIGTVSVPGASASDASSYCNPSQVAITKRTNGQDADDPNGDDVPSIAPGAAVTWTYEVSNNGGAGIAEADLIVADNVVGAITEIAEKGDGDAILAPGEMWIYRATGQAIDLRKPPDDPALVIVPDACTRGDGPPGPAYTNVGTVSTPGASASDPSSYCNPPALAKFLPIVSQQELDWGDNPPPFATLAEENGPRHLLAPAGPMLGERVDAEGNGLPSEAANADDLNPPGAPDDEDGLLPLVLERGSPATITITATNPSSVAATIHGWIDLNFDGMFAVSEHLTETVAPGTVSPESFALTFDKVGYYPPESSTYARFRITTDPALVDTTGLAADGEVEDYRLEVEAPPVDWGDAPSSFNRTMEGQLLPPAHRLRTDGPRFGIHADAEMGDQPSDGADGDDLNPFGGPDDEDGLLTAGLYGGHPLTLEVDVSNLSAGAEVVAWLDLNANGSFDTNERQAETVAPSGQSLQTVSLAYPEVYMPFTVDDPYLLRLRVSTDPTIANSPLGYADDGEVEDHRLTVRPTTLTVRVSDIGKPTENLVQRRVTASLVTSDGTSLAHQFFGNIVIETPGDCSQLPPDAVPPGGWRPLNSSGEFSVDYTSCLSESAAMEAAAIETVDMVTDTGCRLSFPGEMRDVITVTVSPVESGAPPNLTCVLEIATAITLAAFDAYAHDNGTVTITWTTAVEIDNAGFNLYRAPAVDGPYVRMNPQLIAGQGTGEGATYSFVDRPPPTGMLFYKLEDVDYNGAGTFHGPISPVSAGE
jgi:hypothetical protein